MDQRRKKGAIWTLIVILALMAALIILPIAIFNGYSAYSYTHTFQAIWIWGWSDPIGITWRGWLDIGNLSYSYFSNIITAIVFPIICLIVYGLIMVAFYRVTKKYRVSLVRGVTAWTWIWTIGLTIPTFFTMIPSPNAIAAIVGTVVLSWICWYIQPSPQEMDNLRSSMAEIKHHVVTAFSEDEFDIPAARAKIFAEKAFEIGARRIHYELQLFRQFLPKLAIIYRAFSHESALSLDVLRESLDMQDGDFSKLVLAITGSFNLTINGTVIIVPGGIDMERLLMLSEQFLKEGNADVPIISTIGS